MRKAWCDAQDELTALRPVEKGMECYVRFWEHARHYSDYKKKVPPPDLGGLHVYAFGPPSAPEVDAVQLEKSLEDVQVRMCGKDVLEVSAEERGPAGKGSDFFSYESPCAAGPEAEKGTDHGGLCDGGARTRKAWEPPRLEWTRSPGNAASVGAQRQKMCTHY